MRELFFACRIVSVRNSLPDSVGFTSLAVFKSPIRTIDLTEVIKSTRFRVYSDFTGMGELGRMAILHVSSSSDLCKQTGYVRGVAGSRGCRSSTRSPTSAHLSTGSRSRS